MPLHLAIEHMDLRLHAGDVHGEFRAEIHDLSGCGVNAETVRGLRYTGAHLALRHAHLHRRDDLKFCRALDDHRHAAEQFDLRHAGCQMQRTRWQQRTIGEGDALFQNRLGLARQHGKTTGLLLLGWACLLLQQHAHRHQQRYHAAAIMTRLGVQ